MDNFINSIDFFVVLKYINNHSLKVGELMIKMYGKKKVKLESKYNNLSNERAEMDFTRCRHCYL